MKKCRLFWCTDEAHRGGELCIGHQADWESSPESKRCAAIVEEYNTDPAVSCDDSRCRIASIFSEWAERLRCERDVRGKS